MNNSITKRFSQRNIMLGCAIAILAGTEISSLGQNQSPIPAGTSQKFEVASIKPCNNTPDGPAERGGGASGAGGGMSPGWITFPCSTVFSLIGIAYSRLPDGRIAQIPIEGGRSDGPSNRRRQASSQLASG